MYWKAIREYYFDYDNRQKQIAETAINQLTVKDYPCCHSRRFC